MGKTPPRGDSSSWDKTKETNNYWVSIADISQNEGKTIYDTKEYITDKAAEKIFKVKANSLLMSFKLSIGRMAFAGVDLYTNEAIIAIPESDDYNLRFLYYYLASYDWKTLTEGNEKVKGATLNKESIGKIKLPILSLAEQQQIVSFLDSEFEKIDALKANAETQLQAAKDLFQKALKEMLTPKDGWEEKTISNIIDKDSNISYGIVQPGAGEENGVPVVRPIDLVNKYLDNTLNLKKTTQTISDSYKRSILNGKEILMCVRGTTGVVSLSTQNLKGCNVTRGIVPFKIENDITREFTYYAFSSPKAFAFIKKHTQGVALKQINISDVKLIPIDLPSIEEQKVIVSQLSSIESSVNKLQSNYEQTITLCNDLKQSLLKRIFE